MISEAHIEAIRGLKARYGGSYGLADCELIKSLYREIFGQEIKKTNCQNCYHDAVIELYLHMKRNTTMDKKAELKAGAVISCPTFHNGTIFTNNNLTDDVAREYLAIFPQRANLFAVLPPKKRKVKVEGKAENGEKKAAKRKKTTKKEQE